MGRDSSLKRGASQHRTGAPRCRAGSTGTGPRGRGNRATLAHRDKRTGTRGSRDGDTGAGACRGWGTGAWARRDGNTGAWSRRGRSTGAWARRDGSTGAWAHRGRSTGYWNGLPFPSPGIFLTQDLKLSCLHWQVGSLPPSHRVSPVKQLSSN